MLEQSRKKFTLEGKNLRRARTLYVTLIYREAMRNPQMLIIFAQRAQKRGLYSLKTGLRDIYFLMSRALFKMARSEDFSGDWYQFSDHLKTSEMTKKIKNNSGKKYSFAKKMRIRVTA